MHPAPKRSSVSEYFTVGGCHTGLTEMETLVTLLLCSFVLSARCELTLEPDRPSIQVEVDQRAILECCFTSSEREGFEWVKSYERENKTIDSHFLKGAETERWNKSKGIECGVLILKQAKLEDVGFHQCHLNVSDVLTHGTYLQVYQPLKKTINLRERDKNIILMVEGILLLLCVILPSAALLFKSKTLNDLEKKKAKIEEENIYQGLNLDECWAAYDQIERHQGHDPYEDVGSNGEDMQLEKP